MGENDKPQLSRLERLIEQNRKIEARIRLIKNRQNTANRKIRTHALIILAADMLATAKSDNKLAKLLLTRVRELKTKTNAGSLEGLDLLEAELAPQESKAAKTPDFDLDQPSP